jgi:CRISPR-associated endonuclease Csn1
MRETIWGLDLGTTSIGFAVVENDPTENIGEIKKMGLRIFPEGVTEKELEPRNRRRREKRLMRRQLRRRKLVTKAESHQETTANQGSFQA